MKIYTLIIAVVAIICTPFTFAKNFVATSVEAGYMGFIASTKDKNPGAFDQPFISFNHVAGTDDYSFFQMIKFENPNNVSSNKRMSTKALTVFRNNIAATNFKVWGQNFLVANKSLVEDNVYMGLTHSVNLSEVKLRYGAGLHYTHSSSNITNKDYTGMSGGVANINTAYKTQLFGLPLGLSLDYITQFARNEEHAAVFNYDKNYGHQIILAAKADLNSSLYAKLAVKDYKSWGATPNDGQEYSVSVGYKF